MTYKYRFLCRPASSFTCPMTSFVAFHDDSEYRQHGIVEYSEPISVKDAKHYDLAPLFLIDQYEGKQVVFFEDLIGNISVKHNHAGQLFFVVNYDGDETSIVWHNFIENIENGRYKII